MDTGLNLVDVSEVARAHVLALTKGTPGRRYILGGENLTLKQILDKMSAITGIPSPTVKIPFAVAATYAFFEEMDHRPHPRAGAPRHARRSPHGPQEDVRLLRARPAGARLPRRARLPRHARRHRLVPLERLRARKRDAGPRMTRVAIIAAFPGELNPLVRNWPHSTRDGTRFWAQRTEEEEWIAACAGAGQSAATRAFAGIEAGGPIDLVFSLGWAGALRAEIVPGTAYNVAGVIDVRTGERFNCDAGAGKLWLATSPKVAPYTEKRRLTSAYNAALVDMEAAAVARLAAMRGIPFYCIKGVSDGLTDRLPDFNCFLSPTGQFELARFTLFAILRPWYWPALVRMGENSKRASQGMAESLLGFLDERGHIEE